MPSDLILDPSGRLAQVKEGADGGLTIQPAIELHDRIVGYAWEE
jgi:hypothetical protein